MTFSVPNYLPEISPLNNINWDSRTKFSAPKLLEGQFENQHQRQEKRSYFYVEGLIDPVLLDFRKTSLLAFQLKY